MGDRTVLRTVSRDEVDGTSDEVRQASFESVAPLATILSLLFTLFLAHTALRVERPPSLLIAHHVATIVAFGAVAIAADRRPGLARFGHAFGAVVALPVVALCVHLEASTGDSQYVGYVGVAIVAVLALVMSTRWAAVTSLVVALAALVPPTAVAVIDKAFMLTSSLAIGAAIHIARRRCRTRLFAAQRAERRAASERLDTTAQLAGGIAHDFNNLLCVVGVSVEALSLPGAPGHVRAAACADIVDAVERGTAITRQLTTFGRREDVRAQVVQPAGELARCGRMLLRAVGERVEVKIDAAPTAAIAVDVGQLGQVLLNLAVNAKDAMPDGGALTIAVADVAAAAVRVRHPDAVADAYVAITVTDTGTGMDPATAARVFDPYFTTKAPGRGTGLGLSQVHGIVRQHHGFVELDTQPGRGTMITLLFPAVTRPEAAPSRDVRTVGFAFARAS